jgi:hypothetical protein
MREKLINYAFVKLAVWICTSKPLNFGTFYAVLTHGPPLNCNLCVPVRWDRASLRRGKRKRYCDTAEITAASWDGHREGAAVKWGTAAVAVDGWNDLVSLWLKLSVKRILDSYKNKCHLYRMSHAETKLTEANSFLILFPYLKQCHKL